MAQTGCQLLTLEITIHKSKTLLNPLGQTCSDTLYAALCASVIGFSSDSVAAMQLACIDHFWRQPLSFLAAVAGADGKLLAKQAAALPPQLLSADLAERLGVSASGRG